MRRLAISSSENGLSCGDSDLDLDSVSASLGELGSSSLVRKLSVKMGWFETCEVPGVGEAVLGGKPV